MTAKRFASLGDFSDSIDYGVTASASHSAIGPKFLRITDIQNGTVDWESVPWCDCDKRSAAASRLLPGDIVFARTGATTGKSFLIRECPSDAVFASYLIRVRVNEQADPRFVSHFFHTTEYWSQIANSARGAAQPGVNATVLKSIKVPLPPLPEQLRIADILDKADALRAQRRAALAELDTLAQSIFLDCFGNPATNTKGWPVVKIADLLESATYGTSTKSGPVGRFAVLRMNNISRTGEMILSDLKYMELEESEHNRYLVRPGDVLFNRTNSAELVGKTAIFREPTPMAYAGYLVRLRVTKENDPEFLAGYLNTSFAKRELRGMCKSIIGMANINAKEVQAMRVMKPPAALQRDFGRRITALQTFRSHHRTALAALDTLFASLQHRAFRGEL